MIHSSDEYYGKELSDEIVSKSKNSGIYIKERVSFDSTASVVVIDKKLQAVSWIDYVFLFMFFPCIELEARSFVRVFVIREIRKKHGILDSIIQTLKGNLLEAIKIPKEMTTRNSLNHFKILRFGCESDCFICVSNGYQCGMRIPRPGFNSQRVPDHLLANLNHSLNGGLLLD